MSIEDLMAIRDAHYAVNVKLFATKSELRDAIASAAPQHSLYEMTKNLQQQIDELKRQVEFLINTRGIAASHALNTRSLHRK